MRWPRIHPPNSHPSWVPNRRVHPKLGLSDAWIQFTRLVASAVLITGIVWGFTSFHIFLKDVKLAWFDVSADLQLAVLGFFNKSLDVLLISSLEYTSSVLITIWMTATDGKDAPGATFGDFDLKNELTKPWMTVYGFIWRCKRFKWQWTSWSSWRSFLRFLFCLCISICVLLQGLAINTIAIPKQRWYPNKPDAHNGWGLTDRARQEMTITYPKVYLQGLSWAKQVDLVKSTLGNEGAANRSFALSASRSVDSLADITSTYSKYWSGWQPVLYRNASGSKFWTGLNTTFEPDYPVETLSVTNKQVWDVFQWMRARKHSLTAVSTGWTGNLTLLVPVLNTACRVYDGGSIKPERSITVNVPREEPPDEPSFTITFGSVAGRGFPGAECTIAFRQALHSFGMWIIDLDAPDISQNHYWQKFNESLVYQTALAQDHAIARALAVQADGVLTYMHHLMEHAGGLLEFLVLMGHKLHQDIPTISTDIHGLSVVMAVFVQNLISYSDDISPALPSELSSNTNDTITSYPIQWQIYASGPRLPWQWGAAFILFVVLGCFLFGVCQTGWYRLAPGSWTEVPGMMMIAQATMPKLTDIGDEKKASKMLYFVEKEDKLMLWSTESKNAR
jgi:hypothetical protein